ncbi:MAG TPA: diaminopimelate epimerase [Terracidiphilus sp.]|nr:diaminopimelate epimerase [Terracidiphilus sp.]
MIPFTKAHACGNDFLIVTEEAAAQADRAELTRRLCARNTGIGADGIEFFSWTGPRAGRIRLHNADGSIAEISGNGTRCVAAWMAEALASRPGDTLEILTDAGLRVCRVDGIHRTRGFTVEITTGMGTPTIARRTVKLADGIEIEGAEISTGNPHFVIAVDNEMFDVRGKAWQIIGAQISNHPNFPNHTNVEFLRVLAPSEIEIRIFERGVGPTLSSGTGTSAAATAALSLRGCKSPLKVVAPGGAQTVAWSGPGDELQLTGPSALIARGEAWLG